MLLLVGLGNPGDRYAGNRHNVGFMAVGAIADRHGFSPARRRFQGEVREGRLGTEKALALFPMTFMNESGRAVGEAMRFFRLTPADVVVFYDELDLPPGKLRMKVGGGAAGHNGIRSLVAHIGPDFRRARIGIGHPGDKARVHKHVLSDFAKADAQWLGPMLAAVADQAPALVDGDSQFMNRVHLALAPKTDTPRKDDTERVKNGI
ncbi:MAG: aminoacyl-tRNA hydrolase [Rhodobiaceae bacterium]|nr:aminoacyl-tRNA hydrolase [Rhodobiaceae bacterium]